LILRLTLPKAWAFDQDQTKIVKPKTVLWSNRVPTLTPDNHLEGNFKPGMDSTNSSNSPEVGGPFLLLRAIPSSEPFNGKQFDSHAIEHLLELAG